MAASKRRTRTARAAPRRTTTATTPTTSPCAARGPEFPGWVYAPVGQLLAAYFLLCAGKAKLSVSLHEPSPTGLNAMTLFRGEIPPPNPVLITLPPLARGHYIVHWTFVAVGPWEAVAEIHADGVPRFRKLNSLADDRIPVNAMWAQLEIG